MDVSDIRRQKKRCPNQCSNDCYILCGCLHTVYTILPPSYFASRSLFPSERGSVSVVSCSKNIRKPYRLPSSIECRALSMTGLAIWQTVSVWKLLDFSLLFIARYTAMVCLSSLTAPPARLMSAGVKGENTTVGHLEGKADLRSEGRTC